MLDKRKYELFLEIQQHKGMVFTKVASNYTYTPHAVPPSLTRTVTTELSSTLSAGFLIRFSHLHQSPYNNINFPLLHS